MRMRATIGLLFAVVVGVHGTRVEAQEARMLRPPPDAHGFLRLPGTRMPGSGRFVLSAWLEPTFRTAWLDDDGARLAAIDHRLASDLSAQVGVGRRIAFGIDVPAMLYAVEGDGAARLDRSLPRAALGDPRLLVRVRALGENPRSDDGRNEGLALAFLAAATAPLGNTHALFGEPGPTLELLSSLDFHVFGAGLGAMLGYRHRFETRTIADARLREEILYGLGFKLPLPANNELALLLEVRGSIDARTPFRSVAQTPVVLDVGARVHLGSTVVTAALGAGLTRAFAAPALQATVGWSWASPPRDADGDGIRDGRDRCPEMPEDRDGFEDGDGCPDPDNDEDGIPDPDDRCPDHFADEENDLDEDGCIDTRAHNATRGPLTSHGGLTRLEH